MAIKLENPLLINRIRLDKSKSGKPVINFYHGLLSFPVLQIMDFSPLVTVDINPAELTHGEDLPTAFYAHWIESEKKNAKGNPYKNLVRLESSSVNSALNNDDLLLKIEEIRQMLEYLIGLQEGTAPAARPPAADAADALFNPRFDNGAAVPPAHHKDFALWQEANDGRTPTPTEFYSSLKQTKSRIKSRPEASK